MNSIKGSKIRKWSSVRSNRFYMRNVSVEQISRINSSISGVLELEKNWNCLKKTIKNKSRENLKKKKENQKNKIRRNNSYCFGSKLKVKQEFFCISSRKLNLNKIKDKEIKIKKEKFFLKKTSKKLNTEKKYLDIFKEKIRKRLKHQIKRSDRFKNSEKIEKKEIKEIYFTNDVNLFKSQPSNIKTNKFSQKSEVSNSNLFHSTLEEITNIEISEPKKNFSPSLKEKEKFDKKEKKGKKKKFFISHKISINSSFRNSKSPPKLFPKLILNSKTSLLGNVKKIDQLTILKNKLKKKNDIKIKNKKIPKRKISKKEREKIEINKISKMENEKLKGFFKKEFLRMERILNVLDIKKNVDLKPQIDMLHKQFNIIIKKTTRFK